MTQADLDKMAATVSKLKDNLSEDEQKTLDHILASGVDLSKEADSDGDGEPDIKGLKALFYKNGHFSKTATFAVIANVLVLVNYALLTWLAGAEITTSWLSLTIPSFDAADAAAILAILNGAYVGNNMLKKQEAAAAEG